MITVQLRRIYFGRLTHVTSKFVSIFV